MLLAKIGRCARQLPSSQLQHLRYEPSNIPGVPRELMEHGLNLNENTKPRKQCIRRFAPNCKETIRKEHAKLLDVSFIEEVFYLDWLVILVIVKKKQ